MKKLKYFFPGLAIAFVVALSVPMINVYADSYSQNFESFNLGTVNGQDGWSVTGPYDQAVVPSPAISGARSFRISNAVTSGSFSDQTFSKSLANEAGEGESTNGGMSGGTRQDHFEAQFDFASTQLVHQPGLFVSVSPDRGDGSRMSYLGFEDTLDGIDVSFYDVQGTSSPANFVSTTVANNLSRSAVHTAKFFIDYENGPSNDVVKIYIDGVLVHTGTTWENYYRFDSEASREQTPRTTDNLLFRTGGTAAPGTSGFGLLFDNLSLVSSMNPVVLPGTLVAEDFGVVNYEVPGGLGFLKGYSAGFGVTNATFAGATSVVVKLYSGSNLLQTNTAVFPKFSEITGTQFSSPFDVSGNFDYVTDGYWNNVREPQYGQSVAATRVVATVTLANGKVVTVGNTNLTGDPTTIFVLTTPTNKEACKNGGWMTFNNPTFRNQGRCISFVERN